MHWACENVMHWACENICPLLVWLYLQLMVPSYFSEISCLPKDSTPRRTRPYPRTAGLCVQGTKQKIITVVCPTWSHSLSIYSFIYIYISNPVFLWSQYCLSYIGLLSRQPKASSLAATRGLCVEPRRTPERSHSEPFWRNTSKWLSCESEFHSITNRLWLD